jgi:alpha-tubulin suppressor-like RCC1 family protein
MMLPMLKKSFPGGMAVLVLAAIAIVTIFAAPCDAAAQVKVVDVAAGHGLSVALLDNGTVWTWGIAQRGALGTGVPDNQSSTSPQQVSIGNVIDIAAGSAHVLALKDDGTVWAWGANDYGQLGDGTAIDRRTPVQVRGLSGVKAVAAGLMYSVALLDDGTVRAWGYNKNGQLGDGETSRYEPAPVKVAGLSGIVKVFAGYSHNFAIDGSSNVWAWGTNDLGELGDGTSTSRATPVRLEGLSGIREIAPGSSYTIALSGDGTVLAWGENYGGWLGDGGSVTRMQPVAVKGLDHVTTIATGQGISFAARDDGTVVAWGLNEAGLIGNGNRDQKVYRPVRINGPANVTQFTAGAIHALAISGDGSLWGWGDNQFGQMGVGKMDDVTYTPTKIFVGQPAPVGSAPTPVPGNDMAPTDNATGTGTTEPGSDNLRYLLMGASLLLGLIAVVGTLIWLSKR